MPTHKFNLFKLMSKEKIKSYTEIPWFIKYESLLICHVMVKKIVTLERSKKKKSKVQSSFQLWYVGRVSTLDKQNFQLFYFRGIIIVFSAGYIFQVGKPSILEYQISKNMVHLMLPIRFLIKIDKLTQKWSFWTFSGNQEI